MKRVDIIATTLSIFLLTFLTNANAESPEKPHMWLGADISGTTADEARGVFSTDTLGFLTENTRLMKEYGLDAVRLRVWVNPRRGWSGKEDVLAMARRAKQLGMAIMIDFHYSDWWADPGKQYTPEAWKNYDLPQMKEALANHTRETLQYLKENGIDVKWVQVGNESRNGFLWPMAKLEQPDHLENMQAYTELSNAGYDAVKSVYPDVQVIVHFDNGFDSKMFNTLLDSLKAHGGKWDIIGMSVYPYWAMDGGLEPDAETTLRDAVANIRQLHDKYGCEVMVVEVGFDSTKPEEGKKNFDNFFDAINKECADACTGMFYWAPETFVTYDAAGNHHGYILGAFTENKPGDFAGKPGANDKPLPSYVKKSGRPTAIMDSYSRAAKLQNGK